MVHYQHSNEDLRQETLSQFCFSRRKWIPLLVVFLKTCFVHPDTCTVVAFGLKMPTSVPRHPYHNKLIPYQSLVKAHTSMRRAAQPPQLRPERFKLCKRLMYGASAAGVGCGPSLSRHSEKKQETGQ